LASVHIDAEIIQDSATQKFFEWDDERKELYTNVVTGSFKFIYNDLEFLVYKVTWDIKGDFYYFYDLTFRAEDDSAGKVLAGDVYRWANSLKEEIWVFQNGRWNKSKALYKAIQATSWDDIVLDESFKEDLRRDTDTFFSSRDVYESLGITWKRGILLLGPPGNGKTESIKALLHETKHNVLYVKTISTPWGPEYGVRKVFDHARKQSPCILVLEDLDSMVAGKVKSFFLNELDGLAQNSGILTIASTNHPEDIDDAILNRPSRFDTKLTYSLPTSNLRKAFAVKWIRKIRLLDSQVITTFEMGEEELADSIADKTDRWSFAFLKELFVSFLLAVAHDKSIAINQDRAPKAADTILFKQLEILSSQIFKLTDEQEAKRKEKKEADGQDTWCPSIESDSTFVHGGDNF
jgi:hypothetical protein